jgi:general secretion pathway protein A
MYASHFGFQTPPFSITSDPSFLFFSQKHREAYDSLIYGIEHRSGFIEITGEVGCGKTTLCRKALQELPKSVKTAYIFNTSVTEIQFLQTLLSDLGLPVEGKNRHTLFQDLNRFLIQALAKGDNVALFIDEAQNLPVKLLEMVRMLSNLETDRDKLIQIILVGQPELRDLLARNDLRQLRQRISIRCHLGPLTLEETSHYIHHRLQVAGTGRKDLFPPDAVESIWKHSRGIPRVINILCDKALLAVYAAGRRQADSACLNQCIQELEGAPS